MTPTTSRPASARAHRRPAALLLAVFAPLAAVLLAACGGSAGAGTTGTDQPANQAGNGGNGAAGGRNGAGPPGVNGKIAEATKGTLQVQDTNAQTTVTYTASTRFTQTVTAKLAAGDCVTVVGAPVAGSADALTANTIVVFAATNGTCEPGAGRPGARASGTPRPDRTGPPPSGFPGGGGNGGNGGNGTGGRGRQNFATAFGKVTSVAGSTVLISGRLREGGLAATPSATPSTPPAGPVTVTLSAGTMVTKTVAATSAAAAVGKCAAAFGKADSSGTVAATSIAISTPGPNGCLRGFGGFGGRGAGGG